MIRHIAPFREGRQRPETRAKRGVHAATSAAADLYVHVSKMAYSCRQPLNHGPVPTIESNFLLTNALIPALRHRLLRRLGWRAYRRNSLSLGGESASAAGPRRYELRLLDTCT